MSEQKPKRETGEVQGGAVGTNDLQRLLTDRGGVPLDDFIAGLEVVAKRRPDAVMNDETTNEVAAEIVSLDATASLAATEHPIEAEEGCIGGTDPAHWLRDAGFGTTCAEDDERRTQ